MINFLYFFHVQPRKHYKVMDEFSFEDVPLNYMYLAKKKTLLNCECLLILLWLH